MVASGRTKSSPRAKVMPECGDRHVLIVDPGAASLLKKIVTPQKFVVR
jgi:hypothetical protein